MRKLSILSYIFAGLMLSSCDGYLEDDLVISFIRRMRTIPLRMSI